MCEGYRNKNYKLLFVKNKLVYIIIKKIKNMHEYM